METSQIGPISDHARRCSEDAIRAMRSDKSMEVVYNGQKRTVEVHAVGWNTKFQYLMLVWQISGGSKSGQPEGWKYMLLDDVTSYAISEIASLAPREDYQSSALKMRLLEEVGSFHGEQ